MLRLGRAVLLVVASVLLLSMGGAIFAAPIVVPLLFVAARRSPSVAYRVWSGIVVVATVAEVAWALTYLAAREAKLAIWLVPLLVAVGAAVGYSRALGGASRRRRFSS